MFPGPSGAGTEARAPVSVVVPCFRSSGTLARAVLSVSAQTVQPLEIIVVDDASDDGTWDEVLRLQSEFGPEYLRTLRLDRNAGASSARNAGWNVARGELVAFLDADDAWHPRKIEIQYRVMCDSSHLDLTGHGFLLAGGPAPEIPDSPNVRSVSASALLCRNRFVTPSVMLRKSVALRFEPAQRHMEDHRLWLDMVYAGYRIGLIDAPLAVLFKPAFVESGLSSNLGAMEVAELSNYRHLHRSGHIGLLSCVILQGWSLLRFARRIGIVVVRRFLGR